MYDIAIIGCGVIGAAAAYALSRYDNRVVILEAENDVADCTTKANSAILHAGYDPAPGTRMARLNVRGVALAKEICAKLDVSYKQCGSLVLALEDDVAHAGALALVQQIVLAAGGNDVEVGGLHHGVYLVCPDTGSVDDAAGLHRAAGHGQAVAALNGFGICHLAASVRKRHRQRRARHEDPFPGRDSCHGAEPFREGLRRTVGTQRRHHILLVRDQPAGQHRHLGLGADAAQDLGHSAGQQIQTVWDM